MDTVHIGTPALWIGFIVLILSLLCIDLGLFHRKSTKLSFRAAAGWTVVWVSLAMLFGLATGHWYGKEKAYEFFAGYILEESLSVDNIFIFLVIFSYFKVPDQYQHRVLFYGILGAIIMRALFIFAGAEMINHFEWVMYIFGAILILTGLKLVLKKDSEMDPSKNWVLRFSRKVLPTTDSYHGERFFVRENGKLKVTPLFLVLLVIEGTDVVFALDSIPAVFAVTRDPFIVFTSNIFAILGLRSLFFLLAGALGSLEYLRYGLGAVLCFVGIKMLIADYWHVPTDISLMVIGTLIGTSVAVSLIHSNRHKKSTQPMA